MVEMKLHDIGEGMTEGEVVHLLVQVGDIVTVDQPVIEVQTDKVSAELPSPVAGKIAEILVAKGDVIQVGSTVIKIEENATENSTQANASDSKQTESNNATKEAVKVTGKEPNKAEAEKTSQNDRLRQLRNVMAAPYTRKVAREHRVNIEDITGSGKNGRITVEDVERFVQHGNQEEKHEASQEKLSLQETTGNAQETTRNAQEQNGSVQKTISGGTIPFRGRRKQIAQKMTQSMYTIPHVTHFDKIDMTNLLELKDQAQQSQSKGSAEMNHKLSIMTFVIKALTISLSEFPIFNAKLDEQKEEIHIDPNVNLGIATHTEEGLIVPVLKNAQNLSMLQINQQVKELTKKAQANQLQVSELRGGTFTVSNVGPIGGMFATPIINHPEVALISFHQMEDQPVVRNKEIVIRSMMNFSMSFDHRVADGVTAVQFTNRMKQLLENPMQLFVHLT
jgi:2-oxoisovalerate dehydrogenase E2 component (dihydrolipoyl transacylase)